MNNLTQTQRDAKQAYYEQTARKQRLLIIETPTRAKETRSSSILIRFYL